MFLLMALLVSAELNHRADQWCVDNGTDLHPFKSGHAVEVVIDGKKDVRVICETEYKIEETSIKAK